MVNTTTVKPERVVGIRPTNEAGMNPKDIYGHAKVPLSLNSPPAQVLMAIGKKVGAIKYGEYNYRVAKVQSRIYLEALQRHTLLLLDGEDFDRDTGYPHICFILACADIVADAWVNGHLIDTRPIAGRTGELVALLNEKPGDEPRTPEQNMELFRKFINSSRDTTYMMEHQPVEKVSVLAEIANTIERKAADAIVDTVVNYVVPKARKSKTRRKK
jgi:hypothetical protein